MGPEGAARSQLEMAATGRLRAILDVAARLAGPGLPLDMAHATVDALADGFGARLGEVWLVDGPGRLKLAASRGARVRGRSDHAQIDWSSETNLVAEVARTRLPVVTSHLVQPFAPSTEDDLLLEGAAVMPLLGGEASVAGVEQLLGVVAAWFDGAVPLEMADVIAAFGGVVTASVDRAFHQQRAPEPERREPISPTRAEASATSGSGSGTGRMTEQHLRSFVDSLGAILWEADSSSFEFSFVSQRAEEVLGYPVQRWLEEPGFWANRIHPADRDYTVSYRRLATAEGRDHELEYRMVAADGRSVWFQDIVYVDVDANGASQLRGVMVDITQRKRSEQVLLESRERFASLARTLQASLLPPHLPEILGLEVAARYRPAEDGVEVMGDFYDLFDVGDDGWGVVIGDVCGKGPEAAALTAVARYTVRAAAMRTRRPTDVLSRLNDAVLHHDAVERFCTAAYARVVPDGDRVEVSLACGGHPLPLVLRADGSVEPVGRPGMLLGLFEDLDLVDENIVLEQGDALVFFTDGATEAKRGGMMLGEERLRALVRACAGLRAEEIAGRLEDALLAFQNGVPQDDLALVVLRVPG
jgi:sigma-B regulation protein RsbU (phosphoserine phosphatase)